MGLRVLGRLAIALACWGGGVALAADAPILSINTAAHTAAIRAMDVDRAGRYAVTASDDRTARIWSLSDGHLLHTLRPPIGAGNEGKLFAATMTPDGAVVAVGGWSADNDVYVFDRASGVMVQRITGLPEVITQLAFSPDGKVLVVGLWGKNGVRLFSSESAWRTSREIASDAAYGAAVHSAQFAPDGRRLATTSADGLVRLYELSGQPLASGRPGTVFSPVTSTALFSPLTSARLPQGEQPYGVAWSPDGALLAIGFADVPAVVVLRATSLNLAYVPSALGALSGGLNAVAWSADGSELMAAGTWRRSEGAHALRRWAEQGRASPRDESLTHNSVVSLRALPDGRVLYAATDPAWGWRAAISAARGSDGHFAVASGIADLRAARGALRVSADGGAVAVPIGDAASSARTGAPFVLAGFDVQGRDWTLPKAQWTSSVTSQGGVVVRDWLDSARPLRNGRPIELEPNEIATSTAVARSPDGVTYVLGTSLFVRKYKADGSEFWRTAAPATTWQVNSSANGKWVVAAFSDGSVRWYRSSDGSEQLALYLHPDRRRWVLWTPSGYYAAAPGAEDLIGWHVNRGKDQAADYFPASRFRSQFHRPDIFARLLETLDIDPAIRIANAEAGRTVSAASLANSLPPVVEILTPQGAVSSAKNELTLRIAVRAPADAPVLAVRVRVNGLLMPDVRALGALLVPALANTPQTRDITVPLPSEDAQVQVFAENRNGVSLPAVVPVTWTGLPKTTATALPRVLPPDLQMAPKLYVLAVGMSKYKNVAYNLDFAAKDARDFSQALMKQKGTLYRDVEVRLITDDQATKDEVLDGLEWLKREVTGRDVGILFLAGHGLNDNAGNYYFLPFNANPEQLLRTGIAQNDIKITLNTIAGKALFFIDSCHAGNALGTAKTRGATDVNAVVNDLSSAENGVIVFAASTGRQFSQESPAWGNGAFTKALVEGLTGRADFRKTGIITHKGLDFYVAERVKELTKGQQSPVSIAPQGVGDFPIALVPR